MTQLFLISFIAGLLLMVGSMLWGVERRPKASPASAAGNPATIRARLTVPNLGAFFTLFGVTGYPLFRYTRLGTLPILVLAAVLGVAGVVGASLIIARWAVPGVAAEVIDERYLLQGQPARVTRVTREGDYGEVAYEISYAEGGRERFAPARSLDGTPLADGSEVVIERIEDGYAYVEPWSIVEKRL
jgi:hypothetical protein